MSAAPVAYTPQIQAADNSFSPFAVQLRHALDALPAALDPDARLLALYLEARAVDGRVEASHADLAAWVGCSRMRAIKCAAQLVAAGLVRHETRRTKRSVWLILSAPCTRGVQVREEGAAA